MEAVSLFGPCWDDIRSLLSSYPSSECAESDCSLVSSVDRLVVRGRDAGETARLYERLQARFGPVSVRPGAVSAAGLLFQSLAHKGLQCVSVESCTGGLIAKRISDLAGSSAVFWGGFITYANEAKIRLGVNPSAIEQYGAVSEPVVRQMAEKGREASGCGLAMAVSGVAGPGGGSSEKPVGTVWIAVSTPLTLKAKRFLFTGDRKTVRAKTAQAALLMGESLLHRPEWLDSETLWQYIDA